MYSLEPSPLAPLEKTLLRILKERGVNQKIMRFGVGLFRELRAGTTGKYRLLFMLICVSAKTDRGEEDILCAVWPLLYIHLT